MRASISGNNGSSKLRLSPTQEEMAYITGGLLTPLSALKVSVEGDVVNGIRLVAGDHGFSVKTSENSAFIEMPVDAVSAIHDPVCVVDLVCRLERDAYGPVLRSQPFPTPFVPTSRRSTARRRLEEFDSANPRAAAEALFRSQAKVTRITRVPTIWAVDVIFADGVVANRVAKLTCSSCPNTIEISQRSRTLPDEVISKKFKRKGWWLKSDKAICPSCQSAKIAKEAGVPSNMAEAIEAATQHRKEGSLIETFKEAVADVNRLLDEIADPAVRLLLKDNRLACYRVVKL